MLTILLLAGMSTPALAQTPDKLCAGLETVLKAAAAGGLPALASGWKSGQTSADIQPPAGMEGAYSCSVVRSGAVGGRDQFDCLGIFPGGAPGGAITSVGDRVKACLAPSGWRAGNVENDKGAGVQTFRRSGSAAEVVMIEAPGGSGSRSARLSVSAPRS
jgi:hypothetical protein